MKATAMAHPIQGLVKYHGMRDERRRYPYHDSISVCTAPSHTVTTVEFSDTYDEDTVNVDGTPLTDRGFDRVKSVIETVRRRSDRPEADRPVRIESENDFPTNIGLGSSSSGFAAVALALSAALSMDLSLEEVSTIARVGSASAARSVTGGFSQLDHGVSDEDCRSHRIETDLEDELAIIIAEVPYHKETESAHAEAADSHMFGSRLAHVHEQIANMRAGLHDSDFDRVFEIAELDSLSLAATTMTGPKGWIYWQPDTLSVFDRVRTLRDREGVPVYFSTDTGATVYVNTTMEYADRVESEIADCGVKTRQWHVGGPARVLDESHLF